KGSAVVGLQFRHEPLGNVHRPESHVQSLLSTRNEYHLCRVVMESERPPGHEPRAWSDPRDPCATLGVGDPPDLELLNDHVTSTLLHGFAFRVTHEHKQAGRLYWFNFDVVTTNRA